MSDYTKDQASITIWHDHIGSMSYDPNYGREKWNYQPNSAGGVSYKFDINNNTGKDIKYVTIILSVYNSVGDKVSDTISGKSVFSLRFTGPLKAWTSQKGVMFENFMYNHSARSRKVEKAIVEYTDGTVEEISRLNLLESSTMSYKAHTKELEVGNGTGSLVAAVIAFIIFIGILIYGYIQIS